MMSVDPGVPEVIDTWLTDHLDSEPGVKSYVKEYNAYTYDEQFIADDREIKFNFASCDYEAIKEYILTEDCKIPGGNEIIIPKYINLTDKGFDIGTYFFQQKNWKWRFWTVNHCVGRH